MTFERFVRENLAKRTPPDFKQIENQLRRAKKDLKTAANIATSDPTWAYTISYHAMLRTGRALMYSRGYLPTNRNTHKTIVEFTGLIMGKDFESLVARFSRMRRERHDFIYESRNGFTAQDIKTAMQTAAKLIESIGAIIKESNPQIDLL